MGVVTDVHADLRERLRRATAVRLRAEAALARAREESAALIIEANDAGLRQSEVVEITRYNREHLRRLVRDEEERRRKSEPDHDG